MIYPFYLRLKLCLSKTDTGEEKFHTPETKT